MVVLIFLLLFTPLQSISVRESQINLMFLSNTFISSGNSGSRGVSDALTEGANERIESKSNATPHDCSYRHIDFLTCSGNHSDSGSCHYELESEHIISQIKAKSHSLHQRS